MPKKFELTEKQKKTLAELQKAGEKRRLALAAGESVGLGEHWAAKGRDTGFEIVDNEDRADDAA